MNQAASDDEVADRAERSTARTRTVKAPSAFRTISEVADDLLVPQHVLRFWEGRFPQIKPLKRGGGRRYYRPEDIALLRRIHSLLYVQGYTIKGVQRLLRESGGHLADDIPPPAPEEKAGAMGADFLDADEPQLPMPGLGPKLPLVLPLAPAPTPVIAAQAAKPAKQRTSAAKKPVAASITAESAAAAGEVERLKAVLRVTLTELEALRALLP